jgi:hypothetical protein
MRFFASGFFHESVSRINIFRKFVEIFSAQGLPPVSFIPMAICHRRHWHQWRIWSLLLTQMSPLAGKPFQAIATMAYTRWHTRPSQKDLACMGAPSFLHVTHTVCIYCTVHLVWEGGKGGGRSERRKRGNSTQVLFLHPWRQQFTSWVENTNHWVNVSPVYKIC